MSTVVLAYSGGLDTSVILTWLREEKGLDVIAFVADVGQNEDLDEVTSKAKAHGAVKTVVEDLRDPFVEEYVYPLVMAHAAYEGTYLLGTSAARPIIAKRQVEVALQEKASFLAHGSTGKGNDQIRFELAYRALAPQLRVIAPWREWTYQSRDDLEQYAREHGIPVSLKSYSIDRNLLHVSFEGQELEDPWQEPGPGTYSLCRPIENTPDEPEYVEIEFQEGKPRVVNGDTLTPAALLERLNEIGGRHGVGRVDIVENRYIGIKVRGVYETPGGTLLHAAHRAVESLCVDREVLHWKEEAMPRIASLVYNGHWFSPEAELFRTAIEHTQKAVHGTARLKLHRGCLMVVGRRAPGSLYDQRLASFNEAFRHEDSTGFIRITGLRLGLRKEAGVAPLSEDVGHVDNKGELEL